MTVPTLTELKDSLLLQLYHSCCKDASRLYPPTRGIIDGKFVWVKGGPVMTLQVTARNEWIFDIGDGGYAPIVRFCPFCGEELPR